MSASTLPNESPMRKPEVREEVKKALQRISRRLEHDPLTTREEALRYVNANFAGIHGFGPRGLTEAEQQLMWEDSVDLCQKFMLNDVYPQMRQDLERSRRYLLQKRKRFTQEVVDAAYERNRVIISTNALPKLEPPNNLLLFDPKAATQILANSPNLGASAPCTDQRPIDLSASLAAVQFDSRMQQTPPQTPQHLINQFGPFPNSSPQTSPGGFHRPSISQPSSVNPSPVNTLASSSGSSPNPFTSHTQAQTSQGVHSGPKNSGPPAQAPSPIAAIQPGTPSLVSPLSTSQMRGLDGEHVYADLRGPIDDIIRSYYRDASPSEKEDVRSMLDNATFTIKSVRALHYPALTKRFSQVCDRASAQLGSKAETFALIALSRTEEILPQLLTITNGFDLRGSPLSHFTSSTGALNAQRPSVIIVADVVAEAANTTDSVLFSVVNTGYIYPCHLVELEWPL